MDREIGIFRHVARPTRFPLDFQCETGLLLRCDGKVRIPFQIKQGNRPSCQDQEGRRGSNETVPGNSVFLLSETVMSGNFLSCIKGVKYRFEFQEATWDFSRDAALGKGLISRLRGILGVFLELLWDSRVTTGIAGSLSCCPREVQSAFKLQGGAGDCSRVTSGQIDLI